MEYQVIKIDAIYGNDEEPLLFSVKAINDGNKALVEELQKINWAKVFPKMNPGDTEHISVYSYYGDTNTCGNIHRKSL